MKLLRKQESLIKKSNQGKRTFVLLVLLIGFGISVKAQSEKTNYLGINLIPLLGTTLELGYELNIKPNLSFDLYAGYVYDSELASPIKTGTPYYLKKSSGFFIKIGSRYNLRNDLKKFAPFIGFNIVNAIAIEEGVKYEEPGDALVNGPVERNSYNLGLSGIIGITSPATKRINIDLGLQVGTVLVNNLMDYHSYMPGMGIELYNGLRIQGVLRVKYLMK